MYGNVPTLNGKKGDGGRGEKDKKEKNKTTVTRVTHLLVRVFLFGVRSLSGGGQVNVAPP